MCRRALPRRGPVPSVFKSMTVDGKRHESGLGGVLVGIVSQAGGHEFGSPDLTSKTGSTLHLCPVTSATVRWEVEAGRSLEAHRPVNQAFVVKFQAIERWLFQAKIGRPLRTNNPD